MWGVCERVRVRLPGPTALQAPPGSAARPVDREGPRRSGLERGGRPGLPWLRTPEGPPLSSNFVPFSGFRIAHDPPRP